MEGLACDVRGQIQQLSGESIEYSLDDLVLPKTPPPLEEENRTPSLNLNTAFLGNIGSQAPSSMGDYDDNELCGYIYLVLSSFLEKEKIPVILNKETVGLWRQAMTHVTYHPDNNYDALEAVGDKILSYSFKTYLYRRYPGITAEQLNNLDQHYMSTNMQSAVSTSMGLPNWLRAAPGVPNTSEKIREDLMESFFGVIDTIMIKRYGLGFGAKICMKFMEKLFENVTLNLDIEIPKTFVHQLFKRLNIDFSDGYPDNSYVSTYSTTQLDFGFTTRIFIGQDALNVFRKYNKDIGTDPLNFTQTRSTKKPAEFAAYSQVMYYLVGKGITARWAKGIKNREMISDDDRQFILSKAKLRFPSISSISVEETYRGTDVSILQILGEMNGQRIIVYTRSYPPGGKKTELIDDFIDKYLS